MSQESELSRSPISSKSMFIKIKDLVLSSSIAALTIATPSYALSSNLMSWSTIGDVTLDSSSQATLKSGTSNTVTAGGLEGDELETFLNIPNNSFDNLPSGTFGAQRGSAIKTNLTVNSNNMLSFNWNFTSSDNDVPFVTINNVVTYLSAGSTFSQSFATAGNYNIGIGVLDVDDPVGSSTFIVSNVNITAIPWDVPGGATIPALGGIFAFGLMRKFKTLVFSSKVE